MFRYMLALILVCTYSCSYGIPISGSGANGPLSNALISLTTNCESKFLISQIKAYINKCNVIAPPYHEDQFDCLLFYDINSQLCEAVSSARLDLKEDGKEYLKQINEEVDVEKLCTVAQGWNFTDIKEYPSYKNTVSKVFSIRIGCVKVCGVEEVTSPDSKFFCKYYKWGVETLNNVTAPVAEINSNKPSASSIDNVPNEPEPVPTPKESKQLVPLPVSNVSENEISKKPPISQPILEKNGEANYVEAGGKIEQPFVVQASTPKQVLPDDPIKSHEADISVVTQAKNMLTESGADQGNQNNMDKPSAAGVDTPKKEEIKFEEEPKAKFVEKKLPAVDKVKPDPDDYPDSEDGNQGLGNGDDDSDDPMLGEVDTKLEQGQSSRNTKRIETPISFAGEREFYPNTIPDGFPDGDDHFFPFFLTGVILVVLLYVLYHNKSKVSKVFLGLVVEGRQGGRRRNSRGHAYKRLDTLEQAMSTSSTAPPSKIIY